jgi:hypothetical protein
MLLEEKKLNNFSDLLKNPDLATNLIPGKVRIMKLNNST